MDTHAINSSQFTDEGQDRNRLAGCRSLWCQRFRHDVQPLQAGLARLRTLRRCTLWLAVWLALSSSPATARGETLSHANTVGPVTVTASLTPAEPLIGDEVVFQIRVEADAGVELLMPEFQENFQRYTIADFVPSKEILANGRTIETQKYTLQPMYSGPQSIPPVLVEFVDNRPGQKTTPEDFDAYEIFTDRIDFTVQSVLPKDVSGQLKPLLGKLEIQSETASRNLLYWLFAIVLIAIAVCLASMGYWRKSSQRRNAYEFARTQIDRLLKDQDSPTPALSIERFFVEISAVIRKYLEHRFEVRAPDLTTDEFLQLAAAGSELSNDHQTLLGEFLKQADVVKFAGVQASRDDVRRSSDLAIRFLEETRENAPDVDVSSEQIVVPNANKQAGGTTHV
ncbi:MAG: hypothetical protein KDB22_07160 [Planctomycetales bacterium]|nr:hypothetical protein [Planctomycetales bacterium]